VQILPVKGREKVNSARRLCISKKKKEIILMSGKEKAIYNVLRPSTISGRLSVFNKSLSTSGGQVAESAMIGTDGNSWRNL